ncbi:hypothetical protein ANN_19439 [Periplaneta americana]|uniref:Uncharacterized protein n=1 Tax=Periplaneta americana TaxID=6978 RepID=A0ABQ8SA41_PERAM|nr:hypothetical protein ANN_19439 [Periplaneta americana]
MAVLREGSNEPSGSLKAICNKTPDLTGTRTACVAGWRSDHPAQPPQGLKRVLQQPDLNSKETAHIRIYWCESLFNT